MNQENKLKNERNKVIIVSVFETNKKQDESDYLDDIKELENLVLSCEMDVLDKISQNLTEINPKTYVGSGKIEEIRMMVDSLEADTIVCNDELSPAQIENLEDLLKIRVLDRTYIILEIFRRRAKTKEAKIQVEIASLKYFLPRLAGLRTGLSRQGGGSSARNKGKGEKQIDLDRRQIEARIYQLKQELSQIIKTRVLQREKRNKNNMLSVCLVGYTNSGKSSTLNEILKHFSKNYSQDKQVFEKDLLFATLDTSTRLVKLDNNLEFLLTDTVGFINKLPHMLVESFKSTLEEIKEADLVIHVVDSSNKNYKMQIETTKKVLKEIEADNIEVLYAFNKQDLLDSYFFVDSEYENAVRYSAKTGEGLNDLIEEIQKLLFKNYHNATYKIPYDKQNLVSLINEKAKVIKTTYEDYIYIQCFVSDYLYNYLKEYQA
ncbi:MAG: GTPase HflX [Bacilli bacterium]|nr:GTPase HflX [Bacilli bacterium]